MPARTLTPEIAKRWRDDAEWNALNVILRTFVSKEDWPLVARELAQDRLGVEREEGRGG